jgi:hypothetical protein
MTIIAQHPQYKLMLPDWETMRDTYAGERSVKERGQKYLYPTPGMIEDGMTPGKRGYNTYENYKSRAVFSDFVKMGVEYYIGLMYQKPPVINLPKALEPLRDDATVDHQGLEQLLRKINEQQLVVGRLGLMVDIPTNPVVTPDRPLLPYIAMYLAEAITNWDTGTRAEIDIPELNMVVLNESTYKRTSQFEWGFVQQFRTLFLGPPNTNEETGVYAQHLFSGNEVSFDPSMLEAPSIRGTTLDKIPFVFINTSDLLPSVDQPPLMGLAKLALAVYRGEADYRQNLYMQGQDTLVVIGGNEDDTFRTGAGAVIQLRPGQGVDAKYVGVTATGLAEQRQALENDKMAARNLAGQLFDTRTKDKESGEALSTRVAAQAATLNQVGDTGAEGLEQMLKVCAKWIGADPNEVEVIPNKEYTAQVFLAADLQALITAKNLGAPISAETIHDIMVERGMTEIDYEEEMARIENEKPILIGTDAGGNPVDKQGRSLDPKTLEPMNGPAPKPPVSSNNAPSEKAGGKPKGNTASKGLQAQKAGAKSAKQTRQPAGGK